MMVFKRGRTNFDWNFKARVFKVVRRFKIDNDFMSDFDQGARKRVVCLL